MSSLCFASSNFLSLRDEDIDNLSPGPSNRGGKPVERRIDISLDCNFTANDPGSSNYKLKVVSWQNGSTELCGSCSFCNLLADGMQRSVDSGLLNSWKLSSNIDPTPFSEPYGLRANICFGKIEYKTDPAPWVAYQQGLQSISNRDVYLLLLTGYILPYPEATKAYGELHRIEVDLPFELFGEEDDSLVKLLKIHRRPLHGPRLSDQNVSKIRDWIRDCDENHDLCHAGLNHANTKAFTNPPTFLPTRMVDIRDALNGKSPKLVVSSEIQYSASEYESTKYMALSYCWGPVDETSKLLKTTHSTISSRMDSIELNTMPQTFQDAVMVADKLGIRYLWIDSLCIIQDDDRDWQLESSKMAEIFSNAYLTLIAARGSGCNYGFLGRDLPALPCTIHVENIRKMAIGGKFSLRLRRRWKSSEKMAELASGRWVTRGWTFQEERLARRVLMFGENKHFLDCRTLERVEDTDMYRLRPDWVTSVNEVPTEYDSGVYQGNNEMSNHWTHWQTLCAHYSYRELTFPQDKLPAISGIASKLARKVQGEYLAGVWRNNLTHDLFWRTVGVATKPKNYRAPSWSWASLDGRISWPSWQIFSSCSECSMYCSILDAQAIPVGLDPYGGVQDGFLKVQGVLEDVEVIWVSEGQSRDHWRLNYKGEEIGNVSLDIETNSLYQDAKIQALLMAKCKSRKNAAVRGLLIGKNGRKRENYSEYERVGTFTLFPDIVPGQKGNLGVYDKDTEQVVMIV